ncbi:MAG TPA: HK97 family phage prohead protease [Rickettsiales bacterium]|nr:HK97 family phage prohead protease [Rickettsiales bacterium]
MDTKIKKIKAFEVKNATLEIKNIDSYGKFCGYASVFNVKDSYNDIVLPLAFKKTLEKKSVKKDIKLLWQHSQDKPIGYFEVINEDPIGLYVEGKIMLDIQQGREAYNLIKTKSVSGLSIGYIVKEVEYSQKDNTRLLKEVDLFEISVVTFPANEYSNITFCKSSSVEESILKKMDMLKKFLTD